MTLAGIAQFISYPFSSFT